MSDRSSLFGDFPSAYTLVVVVVVGRVGAISVAALSTERTEFFALR